MTLSDLARILRHSDFKDRLRHVDRDRRTIHLGSSFHRGLWTQGDFGTSMPYKSREESIPSSFGAIGETRQSAIAARSTFLETDARAMASAGVYRPLGRYPPEAADTRRLPPREAVKRKSRS